MSTATLLFCSTWLRNARPCRPVVRLAPPGYPSTGRGSASRSTLVAGDAWGIGRRSIHQAAVVTLLAVLAASVPAVAKAQDRAAPPPVLNLPPAEVRASADPADSARTIGGSGPAPCVQVDIAGHRAGHLDCATQALEDSARAAHREAEATRNISVAGAGSPDVEVGVASRAGTRLRLRQNFGVAIRPPAAPPPVFNNPMGPRR
jgi:hypothetical protein